MQAEGGRGLQAGIQGGMQAEKQRPVGSEGGGCLEAGGRKVEGGMNRQEAARQVGMVVGGQKQGGRQRQLGRQKREGRTAREVSACSQVCC
jgi:hypothetical protein